jgi:hypothetical protein
MGHNSLREELTKQKLLKDREKDMARLPNYLAILRHRASD